ncbi:MAG: OadG family transporter subunit [Bacillota bacterium]|nr:OadG family transporter subunit [Bacillota bacterium]
MIETSFVIQVAFIGIIIVMLVLGLLIGLVKLQEGIVVYFLRKSEQKRSTENFKINENKPKETKINEAIIKQEIPAEQEPSPEVIAVITATLYKVMNKPIKIASVKLIAPQSKSDWFKP